MHPASRQRFCLMDSTCPKSKGTTRFRRSPSSTALSCRLAPVATSDNGMSFASANRFFLFPFFFPNRRIGADGLLSKRRFVLRAVGRLPCPGNFRHFGISHKAGVPKFLIPDWVKTHLLMRNPEPAAHTPAIYEFNTKSTSSTAKHAMTNKKYLIPIFKPFYDTLSRLVPKVPTYLGHYYNQKATFHSLQDQIRVSGSNTGNHMFIESIVRELGLENCAFLSDLPDTSKEFVESHFDAVIIPGSNYIQQRECNYLAETVMKLMDSYDLPFILIGVGAQMSLEDTLFPGTREILARISERCASIGVRGELTADILRKAGIHNVDVIGCPSVFHNLKPDFCLRKEAQPDWNKRVAFNTEFQRPGIHFLQHVMAKGNTALIMQNEPLFWFEKQERAFGVEALSWERMHMIMPELSRADFRLIREYLNWNSVIFFNIGEWMTFLREKCAMSLGTRFHGNMVALQAGVPAVWIKHDTRTSELLEFLKLPTFNFPAEINFKKIYDEADYEPFNAAYPALYANYLDFLHKNGICSILPDPIKK